MTAASSGEGSAGAGSAGAAAPSGAASAAGRTGMGAGGGAGDLSTQGSFGRAAQDDGRDIQPGGDFSETRGRPALGGAGWRSARDQQGKARRQGEAPDIGIQPAKLGRREMTDPGHCQLFPLAFDRVHEIAPRIGMGVGSAGGDAGPFGAAPDQPAIAGRPGRGLQIINPVKPRRA